MFFFIRMVVAVMSLYSNSTVTKTNAIELQQCKAGFSNTVSQLRRHVQLQGCGTGGVGDRTRRFSLCGVVALLLD